jgi:hypothetical protein
VTLALRRNGGHGSRAWVSPKSGMRRDSSLGDVKGARHACSQNNIAYAGERFVAQHGSGTLLSTRGVILRLTVSAFEDNQFLTSGFGTIFTTIGPL